MIDSGNESKDWTGPNAFGKCIQWAPNCGGDPNTSIASAGTCTQAQAQAECEALIGNKKVLLR